MLLDAELDHLRTVAHLTQMAINPTDHLFAAMAELAAHCIEAHWGAVIERLQPGRAVGVTEQSMPNLARLPADPLSYPIEQPPRLSEWRFLPTREGREEEPAAEL